MSRRRGHVVLAARSAAALERLASEIAAEGGIAMAVPTTWACRRLPQLL